MKESHRAKFFLFLAILFCVSSCQIPSRAAMDGGGGRISYNEAIQATSAEQMLLNLVRLRYTDSPYFLDVGSITTQTTFRSEINPTFPIPGFNNSNPATIGGGVMWQDQPTITYTPLDGSAFASRMLRPIDLRTIQLLCYSGWDIDRVFRMTIQSFDGLQNAPEASAPLPEQFQQFRQFSELAQLFRHFQRRGELEMGIKTAPGGTHEEPNELALQVAFPETGVEGERLANIMSCKQKGHNRCRKEVELGFDREGRIGIMPRSILSCMYYLSHGIEVPEEHLTAGLVKRACPGSDEEGDWHEMFCSLIKVRSSRSCPSCAFAVVKYLHHWFYIENNDLNSKKTFALLLQLYNLNAMTPKNRGPILTLPLR